MKLKLTGKTDLVLSETKGIVLEFTPGSAPAEQKEVETIAGILLLGTRSTVQETVQKIEDYFDTARRAQKDLTLPKIYIEVDTGDGYVRSEILDGILDTETEYFDRVARNQVPVRIWVKRKNYWEGAEVQIPLNTGNLTGATVHNTMADLGIVNYVGIDGADVEGSIPAQPRIEIKNTYNASARISNVWLGRAVIDNPTYPLVGFITHNVNKTYSGSNETQVSLTELNTNFLNSTRGGHYRIFVKTQYQHHSGLRLNAGIYFPSTVALTPMQKAPEVVTGNNSIVDLGTLQIPPWLPGETGLSPVGLRLGARCEGGFTETFRNYFIFPANAFRQLIPRGYGLPYESILYDDGIKERTYTSGKVGHYSGYGDWITLIPGKPQRLMFLFNTMTGGNQDEITASIKVYYRPRRLTP